MKVVDLREYRKAAKPYYFVEQPMYSYDSTAEFKANVISKYSEVMLLKGVDDLNKLANAFNMRPNVEPYYFVDRQLWLATGETEVYSHCNAENIKVLQLDEDMEVTKTDNTYIRIYAILVMKGWYTLYASSGMFGVGAGRWHVTSGIKQQFLVTAGKTNANYKADYAKRLEMYLQGKRPKAIDYRLFNMLFNPSSDLFIFATEDEKKLEDTIYKAVKQVTKGNVRKEDSRKLLLTDKFRRMFMSAIIDMTDDFSKGIRREVDAKTVAELYIKIIEGAVASNQTKEAAEVMKDMLRIAQPEAVAIAEGGYRPHSFPTAPPQMTLPQGANPKQLNAGDAVISNAKEVAYDDAGLSGDARMDDDDLDIQEVSL